MQRIVEKCRITSQKHINMLIKFHFYNFFEASWSSKQTYTSSIVILTNSCCGIKTKSSAIKRSFQLKNTLLLHQYLTYIRISILPLLLLMLSCRWPSSSSSLSLTGESVIHTQPNTHFPSHVHIYYVKCCVGVESESKCADGRTDFRPCAGR